MTAAPSGRDGLRLDGRVERGQFALELQLHARPGEVVAVLGPNGAGKSTLLRLIAGLLPLTAGRLTLDEVVLDDAEDGAFREPAQRAIGLVFQDGRLFPNLSVVDNVAFGLRARRTDRNSARAAAQQWLTALDIGELADRRPRQLSGGQAQRVALARALAIEPALLLLDEPFAALDVQTRAEVQGEVKRHLANFAGPTLLVTHDAIEALVLADRIVVIEGGHIVQQGAPAEITARPATTYVARLVGMNLYAGQADGLTVRLTGGGTLTVGESLYGAVLIALRPSAITVHVNEPAPVSARNVWRGRVQTLSPLADRVRLDVAGRPDALVDVTASAVAELGLIPGCEVWLAAKATELAAYPAPPA